MHLSTLSSAGRYSEQTRVPRGIRRAPAAPSGPPALVHHPPTLAVVLSAIRERIPSTALVILSVGEIGLAFRRALFWERGEKQRPASRHGLAPSSRRN